MFRAIWQSWRRLNAPASQLLTPRMQTIFPWIAFAIGLFYTLGGIILFRRMAMDALLDKAIAALTPKTDTTEQTATRILTLGALLTFASGVALMAMSRSALFFFVLNIAVQGFYLVWAARARAPENEAERRGRQATLNAWFIFIGAFGLVLIFEQQALWRSWLGPGAGALAAEAGLVAAVTGFFYFLVARPGMGLNSASPGPDNTYPEFLGEDAGLPEYDPSRPPDCLRLSPEYNCWPTWDDATSTNIDPATLGFSDALLARIRDWDALFQQGYNDEDPFVSTFPSLEQERLWATGCEDIAQAIEAEWTGAFINRCSRLPYMIENIFDDIGPYDIPPTDLIIQQAEGCGVLEIRDILSTLESLGAQRAAMPEWDGDTADDISRVQQAYARLLQHADPKYRADIQRGLQSPEETTRAWVRLALDGQAG